MKNFIKNHLYIFAITAVILASILISVLFISVQRGAPVNAKPITETTSEITEEITLKELADKLSGSSISFFNEHLDQNESPQSVTTIAYPKYTENIIYLKDKAVTLKVFKSPHYLEDDHSKIPEYANKYTLNTTEILEYDGNIFYIDGSCIVIIANR